MSRKASYYNQVINALQELHIHYPSYNLGRHLATAFSDYGDLWGVTDKEFLFALDRYKAQLDMDYSHKDEDYVDKIVKDGMDLDKLFKEDEDDYGDSY
jgi:hypothetical protein